MGGSLKDRLKKKESWKSLSIDISSAQTSKEASPQKNWICAVEQLFEIHEIIGQGSSSVVRRATPKATALACYPEMVAIKTIKTKDCEIVEAARQEFQLLRVLDHPHIVQVFEIFDDPAHGRIDIAMELVPGKSLNEHVERYGCLPQQKVRQLSVQLLQALHYLHSRRVCHRDLKPNNVMVSIDSDSSPIEGKIIDFNIARHMREGMLSPMGTFLYMAPELLSERVGHFTELVDVWSIGLCLYFAMCGQLPWNSTLKDREQLYGEISSMSTEMLLRPLVQAKASNDAIDLLRHCLQRDPAKRCSLLAALAHPWCRIPKSQVRAVASNGASSSSQHSQQLLLTSWRGSPYIPYFRHAPPSLACELTPPQSWNSSPSMSPISRCQRLSQPLLPSWQFSSTMLRVNPNVGFMPPSVRNSFSRKGSGEFFSMDSITLSPAAISFNDASPSFSAVSPVRCTALFSMPDDTSSASQ